MPTDAGGVIAFVAAGWVAHRVLRSLERRGWLYYLGRDLER